MASGVDVRGVVEAPMSRVAPPLFTLWILWGSTYLGIALVVQTMPPILANGLRFLAATVVLTLAVVVMQGIRVLRVTRRQLRATIVMGVMLLGVGIGTMSLAQRYVPSGIAALIVSAMPLWIVIFRFRAGDRPSRLTLTGVAVGIVGLTLMLLPGGTTPVSGTDRDVFLWCLAITVSSFLWALFSWRSTRYDLPSNPLTTTVYELGAAGVVLSVLGLLIGERFDVSEFSVASWWGWAFLVFASVVAYVCYVWLLNNAAMSLVATYAYVNPVVAVFLGWLIIGEPISRDVIIGLTIVVGGVVLVVSGERRKPAVIEEPS
ncbi:MAG: EamA family transporter [Actinobacteria bacterium]|nr:EamA family transporter [Actinomycetota bacterium]